MKTKTIEEKVCKNCRYYSQYYTKQRTVFNIIQRGHCTNDKVRNRGRAAFEVCGYWEDIAIKKQERKEDIIEVLIKMSERLDELTFILKDDLQTTAERDKIKG